MRYGEPRLALCQAIFPFSLHSTWTSRREVTKAYSLPLATALDYSAAQRLATPHPKKTKEQVISMLTLGLWGVPTSAQLRSKLLPGDGLIVAVGSPHREFVGDAVLGSRYRAFSTEEIAALPAGLEFDHGLTLSRARVWSRAVPIEAVWSRVMAADTNPDALFLGAITAVRSPDAAIIVAEGVGGGDQAFGQTDAAAAEDSKVIATMNARRAQQGKPPLTAAQEERVRENRRS